jgi:hypothetical protein
MRTRFRLTSEGISAGLLYSPDPGPRSRTVSSVSQARDIPEIAPQCDLANSHRVSTEAHFGLPYRFHCHAHSDLLCASTVALPAHGVFNSPPMRAESRLAFAVVRRSRNSKRLLITIWQGPGMAASLCLRLSCSISTAKANPGLSISEDDDID